MTTIRDLVSGAWTTSDGFVRVSCPWDECDYMSHAFGGYTVRDAARSVRNREACGTFPSGHVRPFAWGDVR